MAVKARYFRDLARMIEKTPGFHKEPSNRGIRLVNENTGLPYVIHLSPSDPRSQENTLRDLQKWGWTPEMYDAARARERDSRNAAHAKKAQEMEAAIEQANALTPMFLAPVTATENKESEVFSSVTENSNINFLGIVPAIEHIDADTAQRYFNKRLDSKSASAFGIKNRPYNTSSALRYAEAMVEGEWLPNPAGIMFATADDGSEWMIDGQHRMAARMYAEHLWREKHGPDAVMPPTPVWVYRNVPYEMFNVIDQQRRRSASQLLGMMGAKNSPVMASALRYVLLWYKEPDQSKWARFPAMTGPQLQKVYDTYKDIEDWITPACSAAQAINVSKAAMLTSVYLIAREVPLSTAREPGVSRSMLDAFIEDYHNGAGMSEGDPVLAVRNYVLKKGSKARHDPTKSMGITHVMFQIMLIIRSWNSRMRNERVDRPSWRAGQYIPKPIGPRK